MMMNAVLKVENLTKKFGELEAVSNVSFEVKEHECLGIIGPNGAGKTTLFNVISGFLRPTAGRVKFMDMDIVGKKPHELVKLGLTRTFQVIRVFKNLTVYENFLAVTEKGEELMRELGLSERSNYLAKDLPQGDLRRLNIGMAMATNPKLLLLDEPFSGLSPKEGSELGTIIEKLRSKGMTIVIIEHKLKELFTHVERVLVLNYGKLICEGTPEEVVKDTKVIEAYLGVGYEGT